MPISSNGCPVKNSFDASAHATGGFIFNSPDRLEYLCDVQKRDVVDLQLADYWKGIGFECVAPLRFMFRVGPFGRFRYDQQVSCILKGDESVPLSR